MALDSGYWETDKDMNVPTKADLVQVVRCKDCKWAEYGKDYEPYCNHWKENGE